ncbi:MAG: PD40 domain-containing protein [Flavobacteriales bacterium]|nr:MAG: PD40 domain-containing protein [Flavobacteriales bacterium]
MKNLFLPAILAFVALGSTAQNVPFDKEHVSDPAKLKRAQDAIKQGDKLASGGAHALGLALVSYEEAYAINPDNAALNMKMGLAHLNGAQRHLCLPYFQTAADLDPNIEGVHFFVGFAHHLNANWDKALAAFEQHKKLQASMVGEPDPRMANLEKLMVECRSGKALSATNTGATVTALGPAVNCEQTDYGVLIDNTGNGILFTSRRSSTTGGKINKATNEYFEDIYASTQTGTGYSVPVPLAVPVNSLGNDASVCLSTDGNTMLIYRDVAGPGDIYRSDKTNGTWSTPTKLGANVNTKFHEGSAWITADKQWIYFVSDRPDENLGGQDIYRARWDETTNDWGIAENLGPDVNSAFDEDGIYVAPDGNTIYFSSKGHNTIGGYDVFVSRFENGFWTKAKNMGVPVNSPDDDLYFVLAANGTTGYFSSVRPGGEGQDDIYRVDLSPAAQDTGEKGK